jgi:hypothetical protein
MHAISTNDHIALDSLATLERSRPRERINVDDAAGCVESRRRSLKRGTNCTALQLLVQMDAMAQEPWLTPC